MSWLLESVWSGTGRRCCILGQEVLRDRLWQARCGVFYSGLVRVRLGSLQEILCPACEEVPAGTIKRCPQETVTRHWEDGGVEKVITMTPHPLGPEEQ